MKKKFSTEFAYVLGIVLIPLGVMLMEKADFGLSMIAAPAYLLYRFLSPIWSFVTFGMTEYCVQAFLLILMMILMRSFNISYLFAFVTAGIYGFILDAFMSLGSGLPDEFIWQRLIYYVLGMLIIAAGVASIFHTYIPPEAYELFVKELSGHFHIDIHKFKTAYDIGSCLVSVAMSFLFFGAGRFVGIRWGTFVCALINGFIISRFSAFYEKHWVFYDFFPWRKYFEMEEITKNTEN